ncbi:MAG TPA: PaaI family thioesterase [Sandaracinaceae bacterium LLY-WYZ-13_1]|nr:PaaI family thioesterase [Sandaracinaceae bacterium LLY-WYZ-13_1]
MTEVLDGSIFGPDQPCFGCAPDHPIGFRLAFERDDDEVRTRWTPDERFQGPPGIVHGGIVAALADEIGAWAVIGLLGKFGFTAEMSGKLKTPVRLGADVIGRGRVTRPGSRVVGVEVSLAQGDAIAYTGALRFVLLDEKGAERMLGAPLPEVWRRFGR